ncbi:hypothetical protein IW261DRAFT_1425608 [Armillaria novae-zelandiae]|uniref:Uncharacterized protein n=1 Tax=Armillaria novae-zelandiae TaxID=153914 RepID=A0AA39NSC8_9AGAR|nr:hypothetical protein IW261DRAFT_1425608 [Armillaria novae-zelandiae]
MTVTSHSSWFARKAVFDRERRRLRFLGPNANTRVWVFDFYDRLGWRETGAAELTEGGTQPPRGQVSPTAPNLERVHARDGGPLQSVSKSYLAPLDMRCDMWAVSFCRQSITASEKMLTLVRSLKAVVKKRLDNCCFSLRVLSIMGAAESKNSDLKDYIVATYDTSTVLVRRYEGSYYAKHFPSVPAESMIIQTNELPICDGRYVDIPEDLWPEVYPRVRNIKIISRPAHVPADKKPELPAYKL